MSDMDKKQKEKCSIKSVVDLIKDIGYGVTLIATSAFLSKQYFFSGGRGWLLLPIFIIGILIVILSPIDFHKKYFDARGSLLKRFLSFVLFAAIFSPVAVTLVISVDYFQYITN